MWAGWGEGTGLRRGRVRFKLRKSVCGERAEGWQHWPGTKRPEQVSTMPQPRFLVCPSGHAPSPRRAHLLSCHTLRAASSCRQPPRAAALLPPNTPPTGPRHRLTAAGARGRMAPATEGSRLLLVPRAAPCG